jgi:hypothetical protein
LDHVGFLVRRAAKGAVAQQTRGEKTMKTVFTTAVLAAIAALTLAVSAYAGGSTVHQTVNLHNVPITDTIPISCSGPGVTSYVGTGNIITHFTANSTGDWFTTTTEGAATLTTSVGVFQGHVEDWFGAEDNGTTALTNVTHATFNFIGQNVVTGAAFEMHGSFDTTVNANGTTTANHLDVHCG